MDSRFRNGNHGRVGWMMDLGCLFQQDSSSRNRTGFQRIVSDCYGNLVEGRWTGNIGRMVFGLDQNGRKLETVGILQGKFLDWKMEQ